MNDQSSRQQWEHRAGVPIELSWSDTERQSRSERIPRRRAEPRTQPAVAQSQAPASQSVAHAAHSSHTANVVGAPEVQRYLRVDHRHTVEHMTPLWRLVAVVAMFGGLGGIGHYLDVIGHAEDAATMLSVTIVYTLSFWAARRPESVDARFGPFSKIAAAVRESQGDIRQWVQNRTLLAGVVVAIFYGIGLVLIKHAVLAGLRTLWSPWLAMAGGCIVGALVVAPEFWRQLVGGSRRS